MKKMNFWLGLLVPTLLFATAIATYLLHFPFQQWVHQNISLVTGIGGGAIALLVGLWWWMNRKNKAKLLTTSSSKTDNAAIITKPKQKTKNKKQPVKFGTFQGVFTPVLLTILGVIMYLREGWVVGNAGLLGAIGIILLASVITFFTALSMSSITTNIRIGAGGAFSIIAQSLGMEAGGAIGIPLYFAQALAVAMYIFGFREGWCWAFPDHSYLLVDCVTFAFVFLIVNISTDFAFKIQYFIMAIIVGSLFSIVGALFTSELNYDFQLFGSYPGSPDNNFSGSSFWLVFAVYFPAVTGIMAGANMSGDLKDPRVNIPSGTLAAIVITTIVYIFLAVVLALLATPEELVGNYNILIDKALWAPIVLAGLLGATFSSALSSLVGAPRILQALGQNNILFFNKQLTQLDDKGEPKNALLVTVALVVGALLMRDLNAIAPLITMFFMITYAMINVVVLVEQGLGQISFRPTLRVPIIVPLLGTLGCFFVMFIINPVFGLASIVIVLMFYAFLARRKIETDQGDTRSGIFNSLAEWAAKVVNKLPEAKERSWQPNLLLPAESVNDVVRVYKVIYSLVNPKGSLKILGFTDGKTEEEARMEKRLQDLANYFIEQDISARTAIIKNVSYKAGVLAGMQSLKAAFFQPNVLFLSLTDDAERDADTAELMNVAKAYSMGMMLFVPYRKVGLGLEKSINLWIYFDNLEPELDFKVKHINIALLVGYLLKRNWGAKLNIITVYNSAKSEKKETEMVDEDAAVTETEAYKKVKAYMDKLMILARLPQDTNWLFRENDKSELLDKTSPFADINIFALRGDHIDIERIRQRANSLETSCLFTLDSGLENALA